MAAVKETHFFSQVPHHPKLEPFRSLIRSERDYLRLFKAVPGTRYLGEASLSYLWHPEAAERIAQVSRDARIIVILREPIDRAFSHYLHNVREGVEKRTFLQAIEEELLDISDPDRFFSTRYAAIGLYCEQLQRYIERFGDAVLVLFYEEFFCDVRRQLATIFEFLEVEPLPEPFQTDEALNQYARPRTFLIQRALGTPLIRAAARALVPERLRSRVKRPFFKQEPKPAVDQRATQLLSDLYAYEPACLEALLGRRVPWSKTREPSV